MLCVNSYSAHICTYTVKFSQLYSFVDFMNRMNLQHFVPWKYLLFLFLLLMYTSNVGALYSNMAAIQLALKIVG